ncbi:MAG: hypothetical protein RIC56_18785 [Pseudomonadales bacterium]
MIRQSRAFPPVATPLIATLVLLAFCGCSTTPGTPLQQARSGVIRELTVQCYWQNEGKRAVFGSYYVHAACRRWADEVVRVRLPKGNGWGR